MILAETTHTFEQCVSKKELCSKEGRVIEQPRLRLLGWTLPLYSRASFDETWTVRTEKRLVTLFGTTLPIGIESEIYTELVQQPVTYTEAQAEQLARERLEAQADEALCRATVTDRRLEGTWNGDTYCLRATYDCVEDIARQVPLSIASS